MAKLLLTVLCRSVGGCLLYLALSATLVIVTSGEEHEIPAIKDLLKKTSGSIKIQGVFLQSYEPQNSVVLTYPEGNVYRQLPNLEEETGEFYVQAPVNQGIMVVVQYLQLRTQFRGPNRNDVTEFCRDYIQIRDPLGNETVQICGLVNKRDNSLIPLKLIGPRTFYSAAGQVTIKVFIDRNNVTDLTKHIENQFQIAFTATSDCDESTNQGGRNSFRSTSAFNESRQDNEEAYYKPCFNASAVDFTIPRGLCIASSLFCDSDSINQCGYHGQFTKIIGTDEINCAETVTTEVIKFPPPRNPGSLLWIIAVVVVVAIIVMIVGFVTSSVVTFPCMKNDGFEAAASSSTTHIAKSTDRNGGMLQQPHNGNGSSSYSSFTMEEPV